ncbi:hypothetical protein ABZW96_35960 [Nocardia sp. NPDC004168]|uniref:effector-associated constant component EACC1 n=1 Tax=Nocardia sp. NPDC004168 TaxID=3154452 RepID=UPI0033B8F821
MEHVGDAQCVYEVRLTKEAGDGEVRDDCDLVALADWLREDPHVGRTTRVELISAPPGPGELGALLDVIAIVAASGFSTASLVVAILQFRAVRPGPAVTIERPGGRRVIVTGASAQEVRRVVEELERTDTGGAIGAAESGEGDR